METEKTGFFVETKELLEKYIQDRMLLVKLQVAEKAADFASNFYILLPIAFLAFIILLMMSFLAGYYLTILFNNALAGYGTVILFYIILLFGLVHMHKSRWKKKVADKVVEKIFEKKEDIHAV